MPERIDALAGDVESRRRSRPTQPTRYGMVVRRADLRTFPTRARVFNAPDDDTDIDRFQESALFPGTPVAIVHASRDGEWLFVVSPLYAAWIEKQAVAEGAADEVFAYTHKAPYVVVTGATAHTVFTPERPELSGAAARDGRARAAAAGLAGRQRRSTASIPTPRMSSSCRCARADGSLHFTPALLPKTAGRRSATTCR